MGSFVYVLVYMHVTIYITLSQACDRSLNFKEMKLLQNEVIFT